MNYVRLKRTLSALRLASLACCSQASALSMALSFSSFIACIFFLMASMMAVVDAKLVQSVPQGKKRDIDIRNTGFFLEGGQIGKIGGAFWYKILLL